MTDQRSGADCPEAVAKVVADLRAGRVLLELRGDGNLPLRHPGAAGSDARLAWETISDPVVVDTTEIFRSLTTTNKEPIEVFGEEPCLAPPFDEALICMVGRSGVVYAVHVAAGAPPSDDLEWVLRLHMWVGGRHCGSLVRTGGPLMYEEISLYPDGRIGGYERDYYGLDDVHDGPMNMVMVAYNFLNCRNIELVEPQLRRHQAKRLARTGVTVKTINILPTGTSVRSRNAVSEGVPLRTVRGHFAHYGPQYGRKLLFGKIAGRFFIPQHARGSAEYGEIHSDYRLHPTDNARTPRAEAGGRHR